MTNLTRAKILSQALKTRDVDTLYQIIEKATDHISFLEAELGFSKQRESKLADQVKRQTAMIQNLENTLWKKK